MIDTSSGTKSIGVHTHKYTHTCMHTYTHTHDLGITQQTILIYSLEDTPALTRGYPPTLPLSLSGAVGEVTPRAAVMAEAKNSSLPLM